MSRHLLLDGESWQDITKVHRQVASEHVIALSKILSDVNIGNLKSHDGYQALKRVNGIGHLLAMHTIQFAGAPMGIIDACYFFFATVDDGNNGPCKFFHKYNKVYKVLALALHKNDKTVLLCHLLSCLRFSTSVDILPSWKFILRLYFASFGVAGIPRMTCLSINQMGSSRKSTG
jgi:hypothetical protein